MNLNKTFDTPDAPRKTQVLFETTSLFRDAFYEFNSFFLLLYVQLASPIVSDSNYTLLFFVLSMALIGVKILSGFGWMFAARYFERHPFRTSVYRDMTFQGSLVSTALFLLLFFVTPLFSGWRYVVAFLAFDFLQEFFYAFNDTAYWAFLNVSSYNEKVRNRISSLANFFCLFGSITVASLAPALAVGKNTTRNLTILGVILVTFYFLSQMTYCLFLKTRPSKGIKRVPRSVLEPFRILFSDKEIAACMMTALFLFLGEDILMGNSSAFFTYNYGYGSFGTTGRSSFFSGGVFSFLFQILLGAGLVSGMLLYPNFSNRFGKKKVSSVAFSCDAVFFLLLFFFGFTPGQEPLGFILTFLSGLFLGFLYQTVALNCANAAEYYEAKTGEEKSASLVALRSFFVRFGNAIQTGLFYISLQTSGFIGLNQTIAKGEVNGMSNSEINALIQDSFTAEELTKGLTTYKANLTLVPIFCLLIVVLLGNFCLSFANEKNYSSMVEKVRNDRRKKAEELK